MEYNEKIMSNGILKFVEINTKHLLYMYLLKTVHAPGDPPVGSIFVHMAIV